MNRATFVLLPILLMPACGDRAPAATTPSPVPVPTPTPAPAPHVLVTRQLTGTVRDEQGAVAGAAVTVNVQQVGGSTSVATDAKGFYQTSATVDAFFPQGWVAVTIRKDGYEDTANGLYISTVQDAAADFHLFKTVTLAGGTAAKFLVAFDGALCGFDEEYPCRHVLITAQSGGTLLIDVESDDPSSKFALGPVTYPFNAVAHKSVPVAGGQVVSVEILWSCCWSGPPLPAPHTFTLKTSLTQ
jgi:hypothetical protein